MTRAAALRSAVEAWRALPARARRPAYSALLVDIGFCDDAVKRGYALNPDKLKAQAAALRAAVKLLRAAGRSR